MASSSSNNPLHLPPPPEYPTATATVDPLANLSAIQSRLHSLSRLLSNSVNSNTPLSHHHSAAVSAELISAVHHVIINGAALISHGPHPQYPPPDSNDDFDIVELDAVELASDNNSHTCGVCGKTFKRDANLRMHMRAHGDQFKTRQSLSRPDAIKVIPPVTYGRKTRFSCPFAGCNRNKNHNGFRPLKSVICVKNHFKRTHCPKKFRCSRCKSKCFSVMSDLRSHMRQCLVECDAAKWRCSCGGVFSTKSELFEHMSLFEGHMPDAGNDAMMNDGDFGLIDVQNDQQFSQEMDLWSSIQDLIQF